MRKALIDADVNFKVVKSFISKIEKQAQGTKVFKSVKPGEQFIKIIHDELISLFGNKSNALLLGKKPSVYSSCRATRCWKDYNGRKISLLLQRFRKICLVGCRICR